MATYKILEPCFAGGIYRKPGHFDVYERAKPYPNCPKHMERLDDGVVKTKAPKAAKTVESTQETKPPMPPAPPAPPAPPVVNKG